MHLRPLRSWLLLALCSLQAAFATIAHAEGAETFLMPVEDVFYIEGRGVIVTGRVARGSAVVGDEVELVGLLPTRKTKLAALETFRGQLPKAEKGANIGLLLQGFTREDTRAGLIQRGQVVAQPGTTTAHTKFTAELEITTREAGGDPARFVPKARLQFYLRTVDMTGILTLPPGIETVKPGEKLTVQVDLLQPVALEKDLTFLVRSGGKTVGKGKVSGME